MSDILSHPRLHEHHVMIVYNPGTGGHFMSGVINRLNYKQLSKIEISDTGDAHSVNSSIPRFIPTDEDINSLSDMTIANLFLEKSQKLIKTDHNYAFAVHPGNNQLELIYRLHSIMPNTIFVSLTVDSVLDEICRIYFQATKRTFHKDTSSYNTESELYFLCCNNPSVKSAVETRKTLTSTVDIDSFLLYHWLIDSISNYTITDAPQTKSRVINLRMMDIFRNDIQNVVWAIEQIFLRELSTKEKEFVYNSVLNYRSKQNNSIISDPTSVLTELQSKLNF